MQTFDAATWKTLREALKPARAKPKPAPMPMELQQANVAQRARQVLSRMYEGLQLYEPLPLAEKFHKCNAVWRILGESNRAGKSLAACAEGARALLGMDPYGKYPKRDGYALFVGLKLDHLALLYNTMFREGAFYIIPDERTGLYRAVRWDRNNPTQLQEYDLAYQERWKPAPPLIPKRMVAHIDWETSNEVPRRISFVTGWRSLWLSALGEPEQGSHLNYVHFDEEMPNNLFYVECHRGLTRLAHETISKRPKGVWSATSQVANVELAELREKAAADPKSDFVRLFAFLIENNPYISPEAREEFKAGLTHDEQLTRYYGIPAGQVRRIYPTYNPMGDSANGSGHGCEPFEIDPKVHTRYVIVDPSITRIATIFVAIDPLEQYFTVYDGFELTGARTSPAIWTSEIRKRQGGVKFDSIIMDQQRGKCTNETRQRTTIAHEYFEALREGGVQVRRLGPMEGFYPGSNDVDARSQALRSMMEIRGSGPFEGTCKLRIMRSILPQLDKEIRRAQTDPRNPEKRFKNPKIPQDFIDTLEYGAAGGLAYYKPESEEATEETQLNPLQIIRQRKARVQRREQHLRRMQRMGVYV